MLPKYSTMFSIIFAVGSFGIVHSQTPVLFSPYSSSLQSVSNSGPGSLSVVSNGPATAYSKPSDAYASNSGSAVSSSGSALFPDISETTVLPRATGLTVGDVAHYVKQLLLNSHVLNFSPDYVIKDFSSLIYKVLKSIWSNFNVLEPGLAEFVAEGIRYVIPISVDLYLNSVAHMFVKVVYLNNALTQENAYTYSRTFLSYVEDYGTKNRVVDAESLLTVVGSGYLKFTQSIGILSKANARLASQIYVHDVIALARGDIS